MVGNMFTMINLGFIKGLLEGLVQSFLYFDFSIEIEAVGVTCDGAKAPALLLVNSILVTGVLIMCVSVCFINHLYTHTSVCVRARAHALTTPHHTPLAVFLVGSTRIFI